MGARFLCPCIEHCEQEIAPPTTTTNNKPSKVLYKAQKDRQQALLIDRHVLHSLEQKINGARNCFHIFMHGVIFPTIRILLAFKPRSALLATETLNCRDLSFELQLEFSRVSNFLTSSQLSLKMFSTIHRDVEDGDRLSKEALLETESPEPPQSSPLTRKLLGIHITILSLYTLLFLIALNFQMKKPQSFVNCTFSNHSPALGAVEIIPLLADIDAPNSFKGNPSVEVDQAWRNLTKGYNTRLSASELQKTGQSSVQLADGSGDYWGIMNSFHNIHCLNKIREEMAPEYYGINNTKHGEEGYVYAPHIAHCIESIRHYIMCHADVSMLTWYWPDEEPQPTKKYFPQTNYTFEQRCVNWPKLQEWAISHSFQLTPENIFQPKYGYPF